MPYWKWNHYSKGNSEIVMLWHLTKNLRDLDADIYNFRVQLTKVIQINQGDYTHD